MPAAGDTKGPPGNIKQGESRVKNKEKTLRNEYHMMGLKIKRKFVVAILHGISDPTKLIYVWIYDYVSH